MRWTTAITASLLASTGGLWAASTATNWALTEKVTACQATGRAANPYEEITVSKSSVEDRRVDGGDRRLPFVPLEGRTCADGPGATTTTHPSP